MDPPFDLRSSFVSTERVAWHESGGLFFLGVSEGLPICEVHVPSGRRRGIIRVRWELFCTSEQSSRGMRKQVGASEARVRSETCFPMHGIGWETASPSVCSFF